MIAWLTHSDKWAVEMAAFKAGEIDVLVVTTVLQEGCAMSTEDGSTPRKSRSRKVLAASAKYEIWLRLVRGEATIAQAATEAGVDRSTVLRVRQVAKEGAMAALAASRPGVSGKSVRDVELEEAHAEIDRLGEAAGGTGGEADAAGGKGGV